MPELNDSLNEGMGLRPEEDTLKKLKEDHPGIILNDNRTDQEKFDRVEKMVTKALDKDLELNIELDEARRNLSKIMERKDIQGLFSHIALKVYNSIKNSESEREQDGKMEIYERAFLNAGYYNFGYMYFRIEPHLFSDSFLLTFSIYPSDCVRDEHRRSFEEEIPGIVAKTRFEIESDEDLKKNIVQVEQIDLFDPDWNVYPKAGELNDRRKKGTMRDLELMNEERCAEGVVNGIEAYFEGLAEELEKIAQ